MKAGFILIIIVFFISYSNTSYATTEYATFESFYLASSSIGWAIAGLLALIAAGAIIFTGGTASPIVISIGTWIGGLMGFSGIAATNAGLAFLGGGAIASGGFGVVGGTVLITAALSFSTDVVFDYTAGKVFSEYKYSNLVEQSKDMYTLPLPVNETGSDSYQEAIILLEEIPPGTLTSRNTSKNNINSAIQVIKSSAKYSDVSEKTKNESLLSLLYFVTNDYENAKKHADISMGYARSLDRRRTLPAFIFATSSLYQEQPEFTTITDEYFRYSVLAESDNPLIPLMFSIYLDRLMLRFNDGYLNHDAFSEVFMVMQSPELQEYRKQNYVALLSRYFIRLKLEQQKITSLSETVNRKIKNSPRTLGIIADALVEYEELLQGSSIVLRSLIFNDNKQDEASIKVAKELGELLVKYKEDRARLKGHVDALSDYQKQGGPGIYIILFILIGLLFVLFLKYRKKSQA